MDRTINQQFKPGFVEYQVAPVDGITPEELATAIQTMPGSNMTIPTTVPTYAGSNGGPDSIVRPTLFKSHNFKELEKKYIAAKTPIVLKFVEDCFGKSEKWFTDADYPSRFQDITYEDIYEYVNKICRIGRVEAKKLYLDVYKVIIKHVEYLVYAIQEDATITMKNWTDTNQLETLYPFGKRFIQYYGRLQEAINHFNHALSPLDSSLLKKTGKTLASITVAHLAKYLGNSKVIDAFAFSIISYECAILKKSKDVELGLVRAVFMRVAMISQPHSVTLFHEILKNEIKCVQPTYLETVHERILEAEKSSALVSLTVAEVIEDYMTTLKQSRPIIKGIDDLDMYNQMVLNRFVNEGYSHLIQEIDVQISEMNIKSVSSISKLLLSVGRFEKYLEKVQQEIKTRLDDICKEMDMEQMVLELYKFRVFLSEYVDSISREAENRNLAIKSKVFQNWDSVVGSEEYELKIGNAISGYMGKLLKEKTATQEMEQQLRDKLSYSLYLFKFISNKEYVEELHQRDLNRRLLQNRAYHMDMELDCIKTFSDITGDRLARHMETMVEDITRSKTDMGEFYQDNEAGVVKKQFPNEGFNVNVLSEFAWPTIPIEQVKLCPDMERAREQYRQHFNNKAANQQKVLKWVPSRDLCTVTATFNTGRKELILDLFQTAILTRFNEIEDGKTLGYDELKAKTEISKGMLDSALRSLIYGKASILVGKRNGEQRPKGEPFGSEDEFEVNLDLEEKSRRIQLTGYARTKGTIGNDLEKYKRREQDRMLELMVLINRVMKIEREMDMERLFLEVSKLAERRGTIEIGEMKRPIEVLMEQNVIKRDETNNDQFRYIL